MNDMRIPILVIYAASALATVTDVRGFRIANALTLPLLASGVIYHGTIGGWPGLGLSLAGAAFGFFVLLLPHVAGGMGAGDVKFMAGVGAWLGPALTYHVLIAAAIAGGIYALILTIAIGRLRETLGRFGAILALRPTPGEATVPRVMTRADRRQRLVPFAAMIAVGLVFTLARR